MRDIAIVGAGQAGLQLALGLLQQGYRVTVVTDRSSDDLLNGRILSSQVMFNTALQCEREIGIDFWQEIAPQNKAVYFKLAKPGLNEIGIQWTGLLEQPFQSVDQRLKFSKWLDLFEARGGRLILQPMSLKWLDTFADEYDLVLVATGKGELSKIFSRDKARSFYKKPPRILACFYVNGVEPDQDYGGVHVNIIPGIGEYFVVPGLTSSGHCSMMLFEGIPGQAFDSWNNSSAPSEQLENALRLLKKLVPWEAERCQNISLADQNAVLLGKYTPEVRNPIFRTASGKNILGMADAVVLNDPIAGQGANSASRCAKIYMDSILAHSDKAFDLDWMLKTFEEFWSNTKASVQLSNLLLEPPSSDIIELLHAARGSKKIANLIAHGFEKPATLFPWITQSSEVKKIIASENFEVSKESVCI